MKKKLLTILLACTLITCLTACSTGDSGDTKETKTEESTTQDSTDNSDTDEKVETQKTYSIGETWTVDGQWALTVNSITPTDQRNEFDERTPAQVFIIDYTYENLGYEDEIMNGIFLDLSMGQIIDSTGTMGYSYPGEVTYYPQEVPVGANCQAQACIGVDNQSTEVKLTVSQYDGTGNNQIATFIIPIG